jgi:hypothetical protein
MFCPRCGREIASSPAFCPSCGTHLGAVQAGGKPELSAAAGILDIVCGVFAILFALGLLIFLILVPFEADIPYGLIVLPGLIIMAGGGVLAIVGGTQALKRRSWAIALAGAAAAAVGMGILGIAALVLTALSRDEFER